MPGMPGIEGEALAGVAAVEPGEASRAGDGPAPGDPVSGTSFIEQIGQFPGLSDL
jgi:hypothetical protein